MTDDTKQTVMVDMTDLDAVKKAITPGTKLVHIETPDNPTNGITDIAAIAEIAHQNGAVLSVDNTFRMERINQSAQKIAEWLEKRENITFVSYPGLSSHPGHETAVKQMNNGY